MATRAIIRTEAVVLRSIEYGETSQIVTLLTREKGKLTVMAKGARRPKSTFGASLQPMAYTQVVFYYKPTRSMQMLSESALLEPMHSIRRSLHKITIGLRIVELLRALLEDEDPQPGIFDLTHEALRQLDTAGERSGNIWPYFQLRLAAQLGLAPAVKRSAVAQTPDAGGWLDLASGAVHAADDTASAAQQRASRVALRAYAIFARADLDTVLRMQLNPPLRREVERLVDAYMRYQFESAYPTKCSEVISQLLDDTASASPRPM
jgi:DNA repair protein RecO (recombination protein O)